MTDGPGEPLSAAPAGAPPPTKESALARLVGVLFSPDETFASIARKPDWAVPLLLFMAISLLSGFVFAHHVDFIAPAREQMEAQGKLTPDQINSQLKIAGAIAKVIAYCSPIVSVIIFMIVAAILMLAYRMMGGEGDFRHYLSVTLYGWVPQIIQVLIMAIILATRSELTSAGDLPTLVRSNPAFLVNPHEHQVLFSLLSSFDVFSIWSLVLMVIGFAHVSRFSKQKSAGVLITMWALWTGLKLIPAAIGAMLGSRK
jgi:hypothetical protein